MTEDLFAEEIDLSLLNEGKVKIACKICNKITEQSYLGLEFYSRKIASRCLTCKATNFHEDLRTRRTLNKNDHKISLKEIEEEKKNIFSPPETPNTFEDLGDDLEKETAPSG